MEAWADARGRAPAWEMENASAIQDTLVSCARTVLMATTERRALTTVQEPVQVLHILTPVFALNQFIDIYNPLSICMCIYYMKAFDPCSLLSLM